MDFNARVVTLLSQLGYQDETPDSIAATCKGNLKRVWEFVLEHARPAAERRRIDHAVREYKQQQEQDSAAASRAAQAAALRAQLHALRRECGQVERTLVQQQEELRLQARAVVDESGEGLLADQEQRDAELLTLALGCYAERCHRFARAVAQKRAELREEAARARARRDRGQQQEEPGAAPGGGAAALLDELQQLVDATREEMQQALDAQPDEVGEFEGFGALLQGGAGGGAGGASKRSGRKRLVAGHAPSAALEARLAGLQRRPPAALLACACALADRSVARLRGLLASGEASAAAANAAVEQLPQEVKERRALMPWTTSPADAALAEGGGDDQEGGGGGGGCPPGADDLIRERQQEHVRLFLQARGAAKAAAAARARLEGLLGRPELSALQGGDEGRAAAALWLGVQTKRAQVAALGGLQAQLLSELRSRQEAEAALRDKWGRITEYMEEYRRQAALLCYLSQDSAELSQELASQSRAAAAALAGGLAPACRAARGAAVGAKGAAAREAAAAARAPPGAAGAAGPTLHRFRLAAQHLCRAGGAGAGGAGGAPAKAAAPAAAAPGGTPGAAADPAMASALQAAGDLDDLAPLRCPAELMAGVIDATRRLRDQQQLLSTLDKQLASGAERLSLARAAAARLRARVGELRGADAATRLPLLEEALAEGRRAREFAEGPVKAALTDWWQQPAQHVVPSVTHEGRDCSQWLVEVQALHGRQRELAAGQAV